MNALDTPHKTLFLSYSRRQTEWCDDLHDAIDTYTQFQRWRDNKIPESADWWNSICLNIEGCFAFVTILTEDYLSSVYCMGELDYALKLNKPVIALMLQDVDYPQALNEKRLQFARVMKLEMPEVIIKVMNASNQITNGYRQDEFSTDIHARPHLRPTVPEPKKSTPTPEEDEILEGQIREVAVHGQIPTRDLLRRYNEEKGRNIHLARELLDKIAKRNDVPRFFKIDGEEQNLQVAEQELAEAEKKRLELKKISNEYNALAHYVETLSSQEALALINEFMQDYPDYGDPQRLRQKFLPSCKNLMPAPFDWIEIPGKGYSIAKYPVTNAQFAKFIDAGGYKEQKWWTDAGWTQCEKDTWTEPRLWRDSKLNHDIQPVVGISWYEAVAFCLWLSDTTGEKIMLPTEKQWQYAAQADDGRTYPWGNDWNCQRCNNSVDPCYSNLTTPVTQYEGKDKGDSPSGVVDMVGNVWEWCLTNYENNTNDIDDDATLRVLRGGSWNGISRNDFSCDSQSLVDPRYGSYSFGFRISLS